MAEMNDGAISFKIQLSDNAAGHLHSIFLDVTDQSLLNTFSVNAVSDDISIGYQSKVTGNIGKFSPLSAKDQETDMAIEIGKKGIGRKDICSYNFVLHSNRRELTLHDFKNIQLDYSNIGITPAHELITDMSADGFTWIWLK